MTNSRLQGHAYNLLGLPGDGSPPARFIRSFYLRGYALQSAPPKTLNDTLVLGQELLNSVYKTLGTIPGRSPLDPIETTPYCTLKVRREQRMPRGGGGDADNPNPC